MTRWWGVRDYDPDPKKCQSWDDIVEIQADDQHNAAERHASQQCASDPECYRSYESGRFLEVKESSADTSTLVSVSVSFEPHFRSRIERKLISEQDNKLTS